MSLRLLRQKTLLTAAAIGIVVVAVLMPGVSAQTKKTQPGALQLTNSLLSLNSRLKGADAVNRAMLLRRMQQVAQQRLLVMSNEMNSNPHNVLRTALANSLRAQMPPEVQPLLEQSVEVEGTLEVGYEEYPQGAVLRYYLHRQSGRMELHFAANAPKHLLTGARIKVKGVQIGAAMAVASGTSTTSTQTLAMAPLSNTFGVQNTAVILVNFQDEATQPYALSYAQNVVFGDVSSYYMENSFQRASLSGIVVGWFTIPVSYTACNTSSIQTYADQAATAAGVNLANYSRIVYGFPKNACTFWGYATIGGSPGRAWINNNGPFELMNVAHEMGHNYGLYHSHALNCGTSSIGSSCTSIEYGDTIDFMGNINYVNGGHFNAFQKDRLGWLDSSGQPPTQTVQSSGIYSLAPYESQDSGNKALKILQSSNSTGNVWYYLEYRQAIGFDSVLSGNSNVLGGVIVHQANDGDPNSSEMLNMNLAAGSWTYPALDVGQSFTDSTAGITITPLSVGPTATVQVTLQNNGTVCSHVNPSLSISPAQSPLVAPGTAVNYSLTLVNNDTSGCSPSTFSLTASVPSGWSGSFATSGLSLSPGGSASTTLSVISPTTVASGYYTVSVRATNSAASSYSGSASATYAVNNPVTPQAGTLSLAVATNSANYQVGQMVGISTNATSGSSPASGIAVTVALTKSDGSIVTLTSTTGSNGVASTSYRLKKKDPSGTYTVVSSAGSARASTSFSVQ